MLPPATKLLQILLLFNLLILKLVWLLPSLAKQLWMWTIPQGNVVTLPPLLLLLFDLI